MNDWNCKKCGGAGMYPGAAGITICDCDAGDGRKKDKDKKTPDEGQEEISFYEK